MKQTLLLLLFIICSSSKAYTQELKLTQQFTTANGLPSNRLYECIQDYKGYLWIGTDNGVAKYDGKVFQIYNITNGLTDNEVTHLHVSNDSVLWATCYNHLPAYYDEIKNKFIPLKLPDSLDANSTNTYGRFVLDIYGNLLYYLINKNNYIITINKNKKMQIFNCTNTTKYTVFAVTSNKELLATYVKKNSLFIYKIKDNKLIDSNLIDTDNKINVSNTTIKVICLKNKIIYYNKYNYYITTILSTNPLKTATIKGTMPQEIKWIKNINNTIVAILNNNTKVIIDLTTQPVIKYEPSLNALSSWLIDKDSNRWEATNGDGLQLYTKQKITSIQVPNNNTHFYSAIAPSSNGIVLGQIDGSIISINTTSNKPITIKGEGLQTRKILQSKGVNYCLSDKSLTVTNPLKKIQIGQLLSVKDGVIINDSILLVAGFGINQIIQYALPKLTYKLIQIPNIVRVSRICAGTYPIVYCSNNNSVFTYNLINKDVVPIRLDSTFNNSSISSLAFTKNNLLWIATKNNGIVICKNNKQLFNIPSIIINNSTVQIMLPVNDSTIWIGTKKGLYKFIYYNNAKFTYTVQQFSTADGLTSNCINSLCIKDSFIYAATDNDISKLPITLTRKIKPLLLQLAQVKIDNVDTIIASNYKLPSSTKFIELSFSAIALNNTCQYIEFAIDDTTTWQKIPGEKLFLEMAQGKHTIYAYAIDVNGFKNSNLLVIKINIAKFWFKIWWIWLLIGLGINSIILFIYRRFLLQQKQQKMEQQNALITQRLQITADLHDDIGASLSSLQLNSTVAAKLIDKDEKKAKQLILKIENQSNKLAEKISDFIWSTKNDDDEFMPLSLRIKNYCQEVFDESNLKINIKVSDKINIIENPKVKKYTFLIIKEALNNIAKYSEAQNAHLQAEIKDAKIYIVIKDDGVGFKLNNKIGNGINNMRARTKELNGEIDILSNDNAGVTITLHIPIA